MGLANAVIGVGATLLSKMLALKAWTLQNTEDGSVMKGQFPAEDVGRDVGANWTEIQALNRQNAFLQFLNGKTDTLSVQSRFFKRDMLDDSPIEKIDKLISWTRLQAGTRRPPLLTFSLGDGLGLQMDVVLVGLSGIKYGMPNALGGIREVSFTMQFLRVAGRQSATSGEKEVTDTRYHVAKDRDYYEALCLEEYGDPMIGVVIRQRNPTMALLQTGQTVALPALEGVRGVVAKQQSIPFRTAFGRRDTPQRRLLIQELNRRNVSIEQHLYTPPRRG